MGVLNVTPDSFSDGGNVKSLDDARLKIARMIDDGADIIDVGGESTRPGATPVSIQQELDRVIPVVQLINKEFDIRISVDTSSPEVIIESAQSGAYLINDVRALSRPGALEAAVKTNLSVCLMHMQGQPDSMQDKPAYQNVIEEVYGYLQHRIDICVSAGIDRSKLLIDPGFGFGKKLEHNLSLLKNLDQFQQLSLPILVGLSRKSMLGQITGRDVAHRLSGSIAAAMISVQNGADIIRVHDVAETSDAIKVLLAVQNN